VLSKHSFAFLTPFAFNVFIENDIFTYIVNSLLSPILFHLLLNYWTPKAATVFGLAVGLASNALTWFSFSLLSLVFPQLPTETCGAYATIVGLAIALVYAGRSEPQQVGAFAVTPLYLFRVTAFWTIVCLRWHPMATVSAVIAVAVSLFLLGNCAQSIGFTRNERFTARALVGNGDKKEADEQASILDTLGLTESPNLSEADQVRRMRALRAIEERLTSMKSGK
jgi:hypothetical protein